MDKTEDEVATFVFATVDALGSATTPASHVPATVVDLGDHRRTRIPYKYSAEALLAPVLLFSPNFSNPSRPAIFAVAD
jgi:hypothetical protein